MVGNFLSRWRGKSVSGLREQETRRVGARAPRVGLASARIAVRLASFKGRFGLVGFEELFGEPVADLELFGEFDGREAGLRPS